MESSIYDERCWDLCIPLAKKNIGREWTSRIKIKVSERT